jgi:hypothetical protein
MLTGGPDKRSRSPQPSWSRKAATSDSAGVNTVIAASTVRTSLRIRFHTCLIRTASEARRSCQAPPTVQLDVFYLSVANRIVVACPVTGGPFARVVPTAASISTAIVGLAIYRAVLAVLVRTVVRQLDVTA